MELVGFRRGCGKYPISYHILLDGVETVDTEHLLIPGGGVRSDWEQLQSEVVAQSCGHWWCLAVLTAGCAGALQLPLSSEPCLASASVPAVRVPPPSRITSSEKYQTSVAKKRVLTYFGHLFIFKLLLSVSVKKLL